jgi:hypothetical protein
MIADMHAAARASPEHRDEIRHRSECCSKARDESEDFGFLKSGDEKARSIARNKIITAGQGEREQEQNQK